ncbi:MAG: SIR2 family protein [Deinococcales bacterium]
MVFVLGADIYASLEGNWHDDSRAPYEAEISQHLAQRYNKLELAHLDLHQVAQQWIEAKGNVELMRELRRILGKNYPASQLHQFICSLGEHSQYRDYHPVILTYTLDDVMVRSFEGRKRAFDVFKPSPKDKCYIHSHFDGEAWQHKAVTDPNKYDYQVGQRPIIIKIKGYFEGSRDSQMLISEDDHLLSFSENLLNKLPASVLGKLRQDSCFLFLGLGLDRWHYRGIFKQIWQDKERKNLLESWAVQRQADSFNQKIWENHNVNWLDSDLSYFINRLESALS